MPNSYERMQAAKETNWFVVIHDQKNATAASHNRSKTSQKRRCFCVKKSSFPYFLQFVFLSGFRIVLKWQQL
jgi:hypothetical protein